MAAFTTVRTAARPSAPVASSSRHIRPTSAALRPVTGFARFYEPSAASRLVVKGAGNPAAAAEEEENPFDVPQTGRKAPMSEDKHADTPEQMAAPEGDKAIEGQKWQPTGDSKETPADRYGSEEAYQEAMEQAKDRTRKSEQSWGDLNAGTSAGGGNAGEGCSA